MRSHLHRRAIAEHVRGCFIGNDTFFPDSRPGARPAVPPSVGAGAGPGIVFGGFAQPSTDMQAVRDQRRTTPLWFLVDLSTARSIAAGTAAVLNLQGNAFYADPLQDASGNNIAGYAVVHFSDTSLNPQGTPITVGPQFIAKVPFTQLLLENIAQPGKFLRIIYGVDIDFSPGLNASVTIGGVVVARELNDGFADYTVQQLQAFHGGIALTGAAANNSHVQLKNPAASGLFVYVDRIDFSAGGAATVNLRRYDTDCTTAVGAGTNKDAGGAAAAGLIKTQNNAGELGTLISQYTVLSTDNLALELEPPVRLGPGEGLVVVGQTVNTTIIASFQWREKTT